MSCTDCNDSSPISLTGSFFPGSPCTENADCAGASMSSACVYYNGPNLSCSGILTLDSVETALQKIDEQICAIIGDYSTYNMHCLPAWYGETIDTQAKFVDAITDYLCQLNDTADTFINNTFVTYQTTINNIIQTIEFPGITCSSASVTDSDSLVQVLTKYCTKFAAIDTAIDITSVDWGNCFTVVSPPTTIAGGFQLQADQICLLYDMINDGSSLPTFNNYTNCLAGTSSDSLVTTIGLIITKLCAAPVFDNDLLTSTCITIPGDSTDLTTLIQNIIDAVDASTQNYVTFDGGDFTVTATDPMDPCAGITVALATPVSTDRFVAVSAGDASPSTLVAKITSTGGTIAVTNVADTTLNLEIANADRGDITTSSSGSVWTIDNNVVTFAKMQDIGTSTLIGRSTAGTGDPESIAIGSGLTLAAGTLSVTASTTALSSLTAATATNTIDSSAYKQEWQWNTLTSSNGLKLSSASTALAAGNALFSVAMSGANVTSSITATAQKISITNTGTTNTNVALQLDASGASTSNIALIAPTGYVGIGLSTPTSLLHVLGNEGIEDAVFEAMNLFSVEASQIVLSTGAGTSLGTGITGKISLASVSTPAQFTTNQDNYNTDAVNCSIFRFSTDASRDFTGMTNGYTGRVIYIFNVGGFNLVIKNSSGSSTAANRFLLNADITLLPEQGCCFIYDGTSSRWRQVI